MSKIVHKTRIIGTKLTVFSVWEPYAGHTTTMTIDGQRCGRVGSRLLPAELNALRAMSEERYVAVKAWHAAQYGEAYAAIVAAHPEAAEGRRDMGEIEVVA